MSLPPARVLPRLGFWCLALGCLSGCMAESAGGPELSAMETVVLDLAGHRSDSRCTRVPVLLGGRVRDEIDVVGEFSIVVDATRDQVSVTFEGVKDPQALARNIDSLELEAPFTERVEVETVEARHFIVEFSSGCTP